MHESELRPAVLRGAEMAVALTRAAELVNLTPGAVSLQIHALAAELNTELFVRTGKRLAPTAAAWRLADRARKVIDQFSLIQR